MRKLVFLILSVLSFQAMGGEINELCVAARIDNVQFLDLETWENENICEKKIEELTQDEKRNLSEIYEVHQAVAKLFNLKVDELIVNPIDVSFLETTFGGIASYASDRSISMGVYPKSGYVFNKGIYTHELGHVLSGSTNPLLPVSLSDLDNSTLFLEMFADLLSTSIYDMIIVPVRGEESCVDRARYITTGQSYNMPQEYFMEEFPMARMTQCCASKSMEDVHPFVKGFCEEISRQGEFKVTLTEPFDPLVIDQSKIDSHQIGIPLISFFKDFAGKTNTKVSDVFQLAFSKSNPSTQSFECSVTKEDETIETRELSYHTVRSFLADLKESLNFADQLIYDLLFSKHAIEKGLVYGDMVAEKNVALTLKEEIGFTNTISCRLK